MLHVKSVCCTWGTCNTCEFPYRLHHSQRSSISRTKVCLCARHIKRREREIEKERERVFDGAITQPFGSDILFSSHTELDVSVALICYCWAEALVADHCENCEAQGTAVYWVTTANHIEESDWSSDFPERVIALRPPLDVNKRRILERLTETPWNRTINTITSSSHFVWATSHISCGQSGKKQYHFIFNHNAQCKLWSFFTIVNAMLNVARHEIAYGFSLWIAPLRHIIVYR